MTHPDDKFRNTDCPKCAELESLSKAYSLLVTEREAMSKELQEKQSLLLMYREQIKQLQQSSGGPLWSAHPPV